MKILLINYEFPPLGGGAGNATKNLAREFVNLGHKVLVVTSNYQGLKSEEIINDYQIIRIKTLRKDVSQCSPFEMGVFILSALLKTPTIIRQWQPNKILAFFSLPSGAVAYFLKKRFKISYIVSLRGGDVPGFWQERMKILHWLTLPLNKAIWRNAERVIANSQGLKELAIKTGQKIGLQIEFIPNGVDANFFCPSLEVKKNNKFKILFIGRLTSQKGVKYLLEAIKELLNQQPSFLNKIECEIVGEGPLREELKKYASDLGLNVIVNFSGWLNRKDLPQKYQSADVFVLPSIDEGMANALLEAMACGLPIIASNISGNDELIEFGQNGFLFEKGNKSDLAKYLKILINNDKLRKSQGQENLMRAQNYNWAKTAQAYLKK